MSNKRAVEILGMSHGAACSRLRKMVLFRQLRKYGDNVCVRCEKIIESIDELSIEHVKPWEGRSAELFWDLDNVAFSHIRCNQADRLTRSKEVGEKQRLIGPEGTSWCYSCKAFVNLDKFWKHSGTWRGVKNSCIECCKKNDDRTNHAKKITES